MLLKPLSRGSHTVRFGGEVVIDGEVVFAAQSNFELEIVSGKKPDAPEILPALNAARLVGLRDEADAFVDATHHASRIVEPPASAADADATTELPSREFAIVEVVERSSDKYELRVGRPASDDSDSELLTLLAENWQRHWVE